MSGGRLAAGLYKNHAGAVLEVLEPAVYALRSEGYMVLSDDMWCAKSTDNLFGPTYYIVTAHSMDSAGYKPIELEPTP